MRRRLVLVALATTSMVALAFLVPLGLLVRSVARDRALTEAERHTQRLGLPLATVQGCGDLDDRVGGEASLVADGVTLYFPGCGQVGAPGPRRDDPSIRLAASGRAFSTDADGGVAVLSPVDLSGRRTAVIRAFVPGRELSEGVVRSWIALAGVGAVLVLVAVAVADRLAASIVRPVGDLADATRRLGAGDLDTRVEPAGPPEVEEVGTAFNRLASRFTELLEAERELVADLSHRLRTPLTALRLDADAAKAGAPGAGDRVRADVEALERTVDELIEEARRPIRAGVVATCDLSEVARDRSEFWAPLAEDQGREWSCRCDGTHPVALPRGDLEAAVDALLGNVFAHTPEGTAYRVSVERVDGGGAVLVVEDDGPGVPGPDVVLRGRSGAGSTGLGLDIVRRTAEAAGGTLSAGNGPGGGAHLEVRFPPA